MSAFRCIGIAALRLLCLVALATLAALIALACGRVETEVGAELSPEAAPPEPVPVSVYMEAESGRLSGFTIEHDPAASGGEYILPPPGVESLQVMGAATAEYTFTLSRSGIYILWGRIHAPGAWNNSFWVVMDDGQPYHWPLSTGVIWFWGPVTNGTDYNHPIQYWLAAGSHRLVFHNSAPGVSLDRLYVTVPGDVPPGNDTPCHPPHSIQLADGGCAPSCGSHGNTTCGAACTGLPALGSYDCAVCCFISDAGVDAGVRDSAAD
jgi:hypothetical protein